MHTMWSESPPLLSGIFPLNPILFPPSHGYTIRGENMTPSILYSSSFQMSESPILGQGPGVINLVMAR